MLLGDTFEGAECAWDRRPSPPDARRGTTAFWFFPTGAGDDEQRLGPCSTAARCSAFKSANASARTALIRAIRGSSRVSPLFATRGVLTCATGKRSLHPMISPNGIAHIQLTVRDLAASRALLHETLGMAIQRSRQPLGTPLPSQKHVPVRQGLFTTEDSIDKARGLSRREQSCCWCHAQCQRAPTMESRTSDTSNGQSLLRSFRNRVRSG